MANRLLNQFAKSSEIETVRVFVQMNVGSTGAPTVAQGTKFVSGIVRNSAGDYTITFRDVWTRLMGVDVSINSGSSAPAAPQYWIKADSTAVAGTRTLEVVFGNNSSTATDPASGEKVYFVFNFKNSSV